MSKRAHRPSMQYSSSESTGSRSASVSPIRKQPRLEGAPFEVDAPQQTLLQSEVPHHRNVLFPTTNEPDELNQCLTCRRNFPSQHFLDLHIGENHDSISEAKRARGEKTYSCFVEGCDKVCATPQKRRMHLIDKHHFPRSYNFFVVNDGVNGRKPLLRSPGSAHRKMQSSSSEGKVTDSVESPTTIPIEELDTEYPDSRQTPQGRSPLGKSTRPRQMRQTSEPYNDDGIDSITQSMSSLTFVPRTVRFGSGRAGFARN